MSETIPDFENLLNINKSKGKKDLGNLNQAGHDLDMDLDEFVTCGSAFAKLKSLVSLWLRDKANGQNYADTLLMQLYGWLSSSNSKLYDPMLHRMVHKMMKKLFLQLVSKLKKLGCQVVHGDFQKLIVTTEKRSFEEASQHIEFVLSQIKKEDMFRHLDCNAGEFWQILLWKDFFNYAGIPESNPEKMSLHFNVIDHLP